MADKIDVRFVEQGGQELENKIARLEQKYRALQQSLRGTGEEAKKSDTAMQRWGKEQLGTIAGLFSGYLTVKTAINFVSSAYQQWRSESKATFDQVKREAGELNQILFRSGAALQGPAMRTMFREMQKGGTPATTAQLTQIYQGIAEGSPQLLRDPRRLRQAIELGGALAPIAGEEAGPFMQQVATTMEVGGLSPRAAGALVSRARERLGAEKTASLLSRQSLSGVQTFVASGAGTFEQGLGLTAMALEKNLPAGVVDALLTRAASADVVRQPKTRAEMLANRIARMPAKERLGALLSAPDDVQQELLGGRLTGALGRLQDREAWQQDFAAATAGEGRDWWSETYYSETYAKALGGAQMAVRNDLLSQDIARRDAAKERRRQIEDLQWRMLNPLERKWKETERALGEVAEWSDETIFGVKSDRGVVDSSVYADAVGIPSPRAALNEIRRDLKTQQATAAAQNARSTAGER